MINGMAGGLNTVIEGREDAPWIVLSHSLGADLTMWEPQMPFLADHYRVLRYDTRGHGESAAPAGPYSFDDLLDDLITVMDAHHVSRADFLGLSLGGMTGLGLAIHHPNRLNRLVCADARADAPAGFRDNFAARIYKVRAGGMASVVPGTLDSWFTADWRVAHPDALERVRHMIMRTDPLGYEGCCEALQGLDYFKDLSKITAEVLYLGGDQDMGAAPEVMQAMADATPEGRYSVIPNAAHVANINQPASFNAELAHFLGLEPQ